MSSKQAVTSTKKNAQKPQNQSSGSDFGLTPEQIAERWGVNKGLIYGFLKVMSAKGLVKAVGTRHDGGRGTPQTVWRFNDDSQAVANLISLLSTTAPTAGGGVPTEQPKQEAKKPEPKVKAKEEKLAPIIKHPAKIFAEVAALRSQLADANSKLAEVGALKNELQELKTALGG